MLASERQNSDGGEKEWWVNSRQRASWRKTEEWGRWEVRTHGAPDSCQRWTSVLWAGRMDQPVHRHPCKGTHRSFLSGEANASLGLYRLNALCVFLYVIYLLLLPVLLAISWKIFSLYVFVANLYVLFIFSWWRISELILPSRKMKTFINFPLYSLEQNCTGLCAHYTRGSETGVGAAIQRRLHGKFWTF